MRKLARTNDDSPQQHFHPTARPHFYTRSAPPILIKIHKQHFKRRNPHRTLSTTMLPLPTFTRLLAGIRIPSTPLINASIALAHDNVPPQAYNHVMRTWLNGQATINKMNSTARSQVDEEAFAVAAILHDMGW